MVKHHYNTKLDIPSDADSARFFVPAGYTARLEDGVLIIEPEESEDERIRKFLVRLCKRCSENSTDFMGDIKKADVLAWLEKQEEQKPVEEIDWTKLTWKDINELERIINNIHYEFPHGIGEESFGKEVLERFRQTKDEDYLDEKEQKPNYCHHEVDLSGCSEEYCKAYYDGWNNCNLQHEQLAEERKDSPMPEDTVIFQEGVAEGRRL